jgi:hypothetical protein
LGELTQAVSDREESVAALFDLRKTRPIHARIKEDR